MKPLSIAVTPNLAEFERGLLSIFAGMDVGDVVTVEAADVYLNEALVKGLPPWPFTVGVVWGGGFWIRRDK
jgi:hypothetical protein